jgi:uncharacterized protein
MINMPGGKRQIPIKEGLWDYSPCGNPRLIGSKCLNCGEVFFPRKAGGICIQCHQTSLKDIELSSSGVIKSFSVVMQQPGGGFYKGPVPYAYGYVNLQEVAVETLFDAANLDNLRLGMGVELVVEKLYTDDQGNDVITYKFRPNQK